MSASKASPAIAPRRSARRDHELEFLPAALEIVETPPSPIGRAIGGTIILAFCAVLAWACFGRIDVIATAAGKIMPSGNTKTIQPLEIGIVRRIYVKDGQAVKAGDPLIELDSTMTGADRTHTFGDFVAAQTDVARLRAALSDAPDPLSAFQPPPEAEPVLVDTQRQLLMNEITAKRAKAAALENQRMQKESEVATAAAAIARIEATLPILQQRYEIRSSLYDKGLGSKLLYLSDQQELVASQKDLLVQKSRHAEATAALAAISETRGQIDAEFRHKMSDELSKAELRVAGLAQDLAKSVQRNKDRMLTAPIDGIVQQLAVHTVGGVVTPAQPLLVLVPNGGKLEIEAMILNQDIGFVEVGQTASIKVRTFDFTKYGLLQGTVESVSRDAVAPEPSPGTPGGKPPDASRIGADPNAREPVYVAHVSLDRNEMQVDGKRVSLSPGMAVTVEVMTGSRRIISYLLSPLLKYSQEAIRER